MADIFLSYSSKDRQVASHVQAALEQAGYSVFWDQETPAGRDWNSWIGEQLSAAKLVIVLWSRASVGSRNVVHEATIAVERKGLIPAIVEDLNSGDFPMGFYTVQAVDLRSFHGQAGHPGMVKLLAAAASRLGNRAPGTARPESIETSRYKSSSSPPWPLIGGGVAVVALLAVGAFMMGLIPMGEKKPADPIEAVLGKWHWEGIACGAGPEVTREGDLLTIKMADTPTFTHGVEKVEAGTLYTILAEPEEFRGAQYTFARHDDTLVVTTVADGSVNTWEACP